MNSGPPDADDCAAPGAVTAGAVLELGGATGDFVPWADGDVVPLTWGPQGGSMVGLRIRIAGARFTIRAEIADTATARDLDYVEGGAILTMEMLYRSADDRAVELTIGRHRADVFTLSYEARNEGL